MGSQLDVTVRAFRFADLDSVQRLIHDTIDASYTGVYPPRAVRFFKDHHTPDRILERQATGKVVVVERDAELVATGAIVDDHIIAVFVHPGLQRRGIGARVMDALEGDARAAGLVSVHLDVSLPSRHFYERRGYRLLESCSIDVGGGERLDYWTAEKSLGASEFQQGVRTDIRKATKADAQAVWELRNISIRSQSRGYYSDDVIDLCTEGEAPSEGFVDFVEESLFVMERRGTIVASGALDLASGKVDAIFVSPQHQRRGLGREILSFLEVQARDAGVEALLVESTLNAQDFYRKMGFAGQQVSQYHSPGGFSMACVVMRKRL